MSYAPGREVRSTYEWNECIKEVKMLHRRISGVDETQKATHVKSIMRGISIGKKMVTN